MNAVNLLSLSSITKLLDYDAFILQNNVCLYYFVDILQMILQNQIIPFVKSDFDCKNSFDSNGLFMKLVDCPKNDQLIMLNIIHVYF